MWASIKTIERPTSLEQAVGLIVPDQKVVLAGGSYLVAEQSPHIDTLIDIQNLIRHDIIEDGNGVDIGAGATLEDILEQLQEDQWAELNAGIRWSCPSRNIRNQRTIGGEIARARPDSELLTYLRALGATLKIAATNPQERDIRNWDPQGIITAIKIEAADIQGTAIQRFALIPSAPAFVIVAGVKRETEVHIAIGGRADGISTWTLTEKKSLPEFISQTAAAAAQHFSSDHYGSLSYKQQLIKVGLKRTIEDL
jgi:CO/xanthine dehydrogenase FAD-binding subunit